MLEKYAVTGVTAQELSQLEWQVDYELVIPRNEVCQWVSGVYNSGKEVYIVSDTYYTQQQLVRLLDKCKITQYTAVIASCEYHTGKHKDFLKY